MSLLKHFRKFRKMADGTTDVEMTDLSPPQKEELRGVDMNEVFVPFDIIWLFLHFLSLKDLSRFARCCKVISKIVARYFNFINLVITFPISTRRTQVSPDGLCLGDKNDAKAGWECLHTPIKFNSGVHKWKFHVVLNRKTGNDWMVCIGVCTPINSKVEPDLQRWFGGQCRGVAIQLGQSQIIYGQPNVGTTKGKSLPFNKETEMDVTVIINYTSRTTFEFGCLVEFTSGKVQYLEVVTTLVNEMWSPVVSTSSSGQSVNIIHLKK